jgi:hypothetical protein
MQLRRSQFCSDKIACSVTKHSALRAVHVFITNRLPPPHFKPTVTFSAWNRAQLPLAHNLFIKDGFFGPLAQEALISQTRYPRAFVWA